IDEAAEQLVFDFFVQPSQLGTKDSICDQLYRDIVSRVPSSGTGWHTKRGGRGMLAARPTPLTHRWGGMLSKQTIDSAQLLASLFIALDSLPLVVAYARFWTELVAFAQERGIGPETSRTIAEWFRLAQLVLLVVAVAPDGGQVIVDS